MADIPKILKLDHRAWWISFIVFYTFLIAVMIGTLSTPVWLELKPDNFDTFKFKGSLIGIVDGLESIPNLLNPYKNLDLEGKTYEDVAAGACFVKDMLNETTTLAFTWDFYHSWCNMFRRLWFGAGLFIVFEVISLVCMAILIALLSLFIVKRFYFYASFCAGSCLWVSHIIAIIGWIVIAKGNFKDQCDDLIDGEKPPEICAQNGPRLGLFVLLVLPFIMVPFFIVTCLLRKRLLSERQEMESQEKESQIENKKSEPNNITEMKEGF